MVMQRGALLPRGVCGGMHSARPEQHHGVPIRAHRHIMHRRRNGIFVHGFGDELLDYITAGPKLRKWYGEGERMPRDGGAELDGDVGAAPEDEGPADAVLVMDADGSTAEQIVLQLILARARVRALVRNEAAARTAYGDYVVPTQGDAGNARALEAALRGARAVICTGRLGELPDLARRRPGLEHLVVLCSSATGSTGLSLAALLDAEAGAQRDPKREAAVRACGVPASIVRVGRITDAPGGMQQLCIVQDGHEEQQLGDVSREDLARVLARCAELTPAGCVTIAVEGGPQADANQEDIGQVLEGLYAAGAH